MAQNKCMDCFNMGCSQRIGNPIIKGLQTNRNNSIIQLCIENMPSIPIIVCDVSPNALFI